MCWRTGPQLVIRAGVALSVCLLLLPTLAAAQSFAAFTQDDTASNSGWSVNTTRGWTFTVSTPLVVEELGFWDSDLNGLAAAHDVGIWIADGTLLTSATVPAGTTAPLEGTFRFVPATSVMLSPGTTYVIGAYWPAFTDTRLQSGENVVFDSRVTLGEGRAINTLGLAFPALSSAVELNANFKASPAQNSPPVADAGPDQTIYLGDVATLHGSATDADGHPIVGWQWEVISAPAGSTYGLLNADTPDAIFATDTVGNYLITLIASDGLAWSDPDAVLVGVVENQPPTAVATASPLSGSVPLVVSFDGTGSSDPEGETLLYDWDFGDGEFGSGSTPAHIYQSPGTYFAVLTVVDVRGLGDFDTIEITVFEPGPIPAVSRWGLVVLALVLVGSGLWLLRGSRIRSLESSSPEKRS
jgi:hypothetical protein